jgi:DNA-binding LacI/PurR family transcriptional regulator
LVARHGTCHRTLRKALDELVRTGTLVRYGRTYRVRELSSPRRDPVVLIARGDQAGGLTFYPWRTHEHLRWLEGQCAKAGVSLKIAPFAFRDRDLTISDRALGLMPGRRGAMIGHIVWTTGMSAGHLNALLQRLRVTGRPVAVLDEGSGMAYLTAVRRMPRARLFSMVNSMRAAREVGRLLLSLGHRHIAFVSTRHDSGWSVERLRGLRAVYEEAGIADGVAAFVLTGREAAPATPQPSGETHHPAFRRLRELLLREAARARTTDPQFASSAEALLPHLYRAVRPVSEAQAAAPLLASAFADRNITAWVGVNDDVAVASLTFLQARGIDVPREITVIGFDDTIDAYLCGLTSYNFNGEAAMRDTLAHVVDPSSVPGRSGEPVLIDGYIARRNTDGAVPNVNV